ncbi:MAG: S8 family serine peptidase, partial [Candidatus Nanohalobium sp.]
MEKVGQEINRRFDGVKRFSENYWILEANCSELESLARIKGVSKISGAVRNPSKLNDVSRKVLGVEKVQSDLGLTGDGLTAGVWDGGWAGGHSDLNYSGKRIVGDKGEACGKCSLDNHATHVAGTLLGGGKIDYSLRGMAPDSRLLTYEWPNNGSELYSETDEALTDYNAVVSQNSWGFKPENCSFTYIYGDYSGWSELYDKIVRGDASGVSEDITVVFAAGNERDRCTPNFNTTIYPSTAKNVITVGALEYNSDPAFFSSWGPTDDGRIKPDLMANGYAVNSTVPGNNYEEKSGTSMAAPAVSGSAVLVQEKFNQSYGRLPEPATVKGLLIHNAEDVNLTGPDYYTGWGRVNSSRTVKYVEKAFTERLVRRGRLSQGGKDVYSFNISRGESANFTLVWSDYWGSYLVNDLDLVVRNGSGHRYYPWTINWSTRRSGATRESEDHTNNVEQVYIPEVNSGTVQITVNGTNLPQSPQTYSLIVSEEVRNPPDLTIEYPKNKTYSETPDFNLTAGRPVETAVFSINSNTNHSMKNTTAKKFYNTSTEASEGVHTAKFHVEYVEDEWKKLEKTFTVDKTPPSLKPVKPVENANISGKTNVSAVWKDSLTEVTAEASITNSTTEIISQKLNYTLNTENLEEGLYNISFTAVDRAGNTNSSETFFTADNKPPEINTVYPQDKAVKENFWINASYRDQTTGIENASYNITNSSGLQKSGGFNTSLDSRNFKDGFYNLSFRFKDYAGNTNYSNTSLTIDNSKPKLQALTLTNNSYVAVDFWVNASATDETSGIADSGFKLFNDTWSESKQLNSSIDTSKLGGSSYWIKLNATDRAGNKVTKAYNVSLDREKPFLELKKPSNNSLITGFFNVNATYKDNLSGIKRAEFFIKNKTSLQYSKDFNQTVNSSKIKDGYYKLFAEAEDNAGNLEKAVLNIRIDNKAPKITSATIKDNANISGLKDINITTWDVSGLQNASFTVENGSGQLITWKKLNYSSFDTSNYRNGSYSFKIYLNDTLGNEKTVTYSNVYIDNQRPELSLKEFNSSETRNGWIKDNKTVFLSCQDNETRPSNLSVSSGSLIASEGAESSNLTFGKHGNRTYTFKCRDYAGNIDSVTRRYSIDRKPPEIKAVYPKEGSKTGLNPVIEAEFNNEGRESGLNYSSSQLTSTEGSTSIEINQGSFK